jgi:DNA-binding CsgD family transcriptional regulator
LADDASWDELSDRQVRLARRAGAHVLLHFALAERFSFTLLSGRFAAATALATEREVIGEVTGSPAGLGQALWLAAWRGRDAEAVALIETRRREVLRRGEGQWLAFAAWLRALLFNGLGRYDDALGAAEQIPEHPLDIGLAGRALSELVEAAVRSGHGERAVAPCHRLEEIARGCGTDWALGLAAGARALLSEGDAAESGHREAIDRLARTRIHSASARAHLLYGEWLRRERRRMDAREHLRHAHAMFVEMGADGFAERTRRELSATGDTAHRRAAAAPAVLTAQELQIARLAADGRTNPEIGAQLFLSARTVEWHLGKVFTKLGVTSRHALRDVL